MKIKPHAMIFYGTMKVLFYLVLPLMIFSILETTGIMQVSDAFVMGIIVIGIIGTAITVLNHTFKKDKVASGYASIIDSIWSAIYLFYVFGGFTIGDGFGNYFISTSFNEYYISAGIGLQLIAYLLMIGAGIKLFQHIFRTAELKKDKEYNFKFKRKFRASKFFKVLGTSCSLILVGYIISIPVAVINIDLDMVGGFSSTYDDNSTPLNFTDDTLSMHMMFNVDNQGVYSILNMRLDIGLYVYDCVNVSGPTLPDGTKVGGTADRYYQFLAFTTTNSENFTISIYSQHLFELAISNATMVFQLSFEARYAGITADVDASFTQEWTNATSFFP